jgi:hypothetical protein
VVELHWLAVTLVTTIVLGILLWGLRKVPAADCKEAREICSDDVPPAAPFEVSLAPEPLSVSVVTARRILTSIWGVDTPDLTVSYWMNPEFPTIRLRSFQQTFLPMEEGLLEALGDMETRIYETAVEQEVPERSRFLTAWTFIHLPPCRRDLVVQSFFAGTRLDHKFYLMDADGKLGVLNVSGNPSGAALFGTMWFPYRCALHALQQGAAGAEEQEVLRHAALALELDPDNLMARLEKSRTGDGSALRDTIAALKVFLASQTDEEAQAGFLLAQSLEALGQGNAAGMLSALLMEDSSNESINRLLRLIRHHERGAQT